MSAPALKPAPVEPAPVLDEAVERETTELVATLRQFVHEVRSGREIGTPAFRDWLQPALAASREAGRRERDLEVEHIHQNAANWRNEAIEDAKAARAELATARAAAEQARADTERLATIEQIGCVTISRNVVGSQPAFFAVYEEGNGREMGRGRTLREALDAAMADAARGAPHAGGSAE